MYIVWKINHHRTAEYELDFYGNISLDQIQQSNRRFALEYYHFHDNIRCGNYRLILLKENEGIFKFSKFRIQILDYQKIDIKLFFNVFFSHFNQKSPGIKNIIFF